MKHPRKNNPTQQKDASLLPRRKDGPFLVNNLTVKDARHLLRHEGGEASRAEYAVQWITIGFTAWFSARAIRQDGATAWHLMLPFLAQYLALLVSLPILNAWFRLKGLRQEVRKCYLNLAFWVAAVLIALGVRAGMHRVGLATQWSQDTAWLKASIREHGMLWPMLSAAVGFAFSLPARFRVFRDHGPPFVSVSFGCAVKIVILFLGAFLLPVILAHPARAVWLLWAALAMADIVALAGLWDIRRRLGRLDALNPASTDLPYFPPAPIPDREPPP